MYDVTVERFVRAEPEPIWDLMTDVATYADSISGVEAVEQLDDLPEFGVGTSWRETRKMFGKEATEEMTVTAVDPGKSYAVEAQSHGAIYRSLISVTPTKDGSTLAMSFSGEPTNMLSRVMGATVGRLFQGATKKALVQDLDDIAALAESQSR